MERKKESKRKKTLKLKKVRGKKVSQIFQRISWHLQERKFQHLK